MRTVGVLGNATGDPYSLRLVEVAAQELVSQGFHAVCFAGGFPQAPVFRDASDRLLLPPSIDGWVVLCGALRVPASEFEALRGGRAYVSVGLELAGTPSITASDETGIFQAVAHLVRRHDRRRIAFVAGPSTSTEAARRLATYRMALESVGLKPDAALVTEGDYETRSGREAVQRLERQGNGYDAIIAANDLMAVGVIEGLRASGRRVPEDVLVVGFDDIEEASFSGPTLTTVRQPLQEMGTTAARLAIEQLAGAAVEQHTVVTAPLVIRESCGCRSDSDAPERRPASAGTDPKRTQSLRETALRDRVRKELAHSRQLRELSRLAEGLDAASDYPDLEQPLSGICQLLGVRRLLVATYSGAQRHARITLESSGGSVVFHPRPQALPTEQLLPQGFLQQDQPRQLGVQGLELGGEQLGYLVLEGDLRHGYAFLELRRHLSNALSRIAQARELRRLYTAEKKRG